MEAELADRRRRRLIVIFGVVLAVVAAAGTYYLLTQRANEPAPAITRTVVVAAANIPARTVIDASMLRTQEVADSSALINVLSDPTLAVGNTTAVDVRSGDLITGSMFTEATEGGLQILAPGETVSPDSPVWRAVSLNIPADRAVAGLISTGDHVDLFVTLTPQLFDLSGGVQASAAPGQSPAPILVDPDHSGPMALGYYAASTTKLTWTDVEVLDVDADNGNYVLKVDEHQAEEIAHIQAIGATFTIGLRPTTDDRAVDHSVYGETTNQIIDDYGFHIPNMIEVPLELPSPKP